MMQQRGSDGRFTKAVSLSQLGVELQRLFLLAPPAMVTELQKRAAHDVFVALPPATPVGTLGSAGRPATSTHPGKMRGSWLPSVGTAQYANLPDRGSYPIPGADLVDSVVAQIQPDTQVFITDDATTEGSSQSYAPVIFAGRHTDSRGRQAGSLQAPEGLLPTIKAALGRSEEWARAAIQKALEVCGF